MKKHYAVMVVLSLLVTTVIQAQGLRFANKNSKLTTTAFHSGCPVTIVDWNGDGLDDIIRLDAGRHAYVEVQRTNATFQSLFIGSFSTGTSGSWAWAMCTADLDKNGYLDIIAGSSSSLRLIMTDANGMMGTMTTLSTSNFFVQNLTCGDFNNDGWIDLFACDDNAMSHIYLNNGTGALSESFTTMNFDVTGTDDSGNYGSIFSDFDNDGDLDLYIAKCRQGVTSPTDGRRINVLFVNDGNNNYTEAAASYGLAIGWQTWTASFGDIDNDGDFDALITNHDHESQILENDGTGHFTDITASTGFDITDITPIQSVIEDFDNDGFADLFITGSNSRFYRNNGNKTFTRIEGLFNTNKMSSFAIGDLNHDGKIDIYGSYATLYTNPSSVDDVIWMNNSRNDNHFLNLHLTGTQSNKGAIGTRAFLYHNGVVQTREVRSGESYGAVNSAMLHFGLGTNALIDSVVVRFPSGITQTLVNPQADQFIHIIENDCVSPYSGLTYTQPAPVICTGNTETLNAPTGFSYLWSDNSTGPSLNITTGGEYNVLVSTPGNNCSSLSPTWIVEENPDQTPVITADAETEFCNGGSVNLISDAYGISAFTWSNGGSSANTTVGQSGAYTLTVQGYCGTFVSNSISVTAHIIPDPVASNVSIPTPGPATLSATGTNILWYDDVNATTPIGIGSTFVTPAISGSETYWAENNENYNGGTFATGQAVHGGSTSYSPSGNTNAVTYFDVAKPCTLKTVKVYTDTPGMRRFELRDSQDNLLQYADVMVNPDTQIVALNFVLTPGTDYNLGTSDSLNLLIAGWNQPGPRFKRNSMSSALPYPYVIQNGLTITGNSFGNQYFFYFYDWNVELTGLTCYSNRVPVIASVTTGIGTVTSQAIGVYPNPAEDILFIRNDLNQPMRLRMADATGRLVMDRQLDAQQRSMSVSHLSSGVYSIELLSGESLLRDKVIIR